MHGLRGEEMMAQVDVLRPVPIFDADFGDLVPLVVGRVVDENADGPELREVSLDRRPERRDVGDVAFEKERALARRPASSLARASPASACRSTKATRALIAGEGAHDVGADAGGAAADEDDASGKARIGREGQAAACGMRQLRAGIEQAGMRHVDPERHQFARASARGPDRSGRRSRDRRSSRPHWFRRRSARPLRPARSASPAPACAPSESGS